ncbi:MAG TPA: serine/threonine-protein kinase [Gemmataceae bacterium]|jgi:serine/threonine protein kinase/WD40 repeat protein|nr:serine/threonine-protein kinase [Gemmataceae bacterium]
MDEARLDHLLDQYQQLVDGGQEPALDELCRECPELRAELSRRVHRLHKLGQILGDPVAVEPDPLSLSDDRTWVTGATPRDGTVVEIPAPPGYEIIAPLGEGGIGVVYKARQLGLDRLVALKMILGGSRVREIDLARFREESRAIAALRHPNIVQIHEVGEFRRQPFFSLEFCAGGTLARALSGQPQPPQVAANIAEVLARAIQSAHDKNIVHRDLKPGNVLLCVDSDDQAGGHSTLIGDGPTVDVAPRLLCNPELILKVSDFGLAKRVDDDSGHTVDGSVMGTPSYMAPEQARGELKSIGPLADVWALGAILYELLTGRPPFKGSSVYETLEQVRTGDPVPVRQLQPKLPVDLETICLKCLEKEPRRRYASAAELANDLKRFRTNRAILARPIGRLGHAYRWYRREPRLAALVTCILVLTATLPAILVGFNARLTHTQDMLAETRRANVAALQAERAAYLNAEAQRYYAGISAAARMRAQPYVGWTWDARKQLADACLAGTPDRDPMVIRSELAAAAGSIDLRRKSTVAEGHLAGAIAFDARGRLAIAPHLSQPLLGVRFVALIDPASGTEKRLPFPGKLTIRWSDVTTALTFSPDSRWLFLGLRSGTVIRWNVTAADPTRFGWDAHTGEVAGIVFSPDSNWVYTASYDGQVKRWPIDGDGKKAAAAWPERPANPKARLRSGIAYWTGARTGVLVQGPGGAKLLDPETLAELGTNDAQIAPAFAAVPGEILAHPASSTVIVERGENLDVVLWDRGICQTVSSLRDAILENGSAHTGQIEGLALHPSGMLLATICEKEGLAKLWDLATSELVATIPAASGRAIAFSLDGRTLAVGGDHVTMLYEVGGLREQIYLGRRGFPIRAIGQTADGRMATIAARRRADNPNQGSIVASIWNAEGKLEHSVFQQADGQLRAEHFQIAASPASGQTVFHAGNDELIWLNRGGVNTVPVKFKHDGHIDISLDRTGRAWSAEGTEKPGMREQGWSDAQWVSAGWSTGTRRDLTCVCAADNCLVVGCENAYVRVIHPDGGPIRECECFERNASTFLTDRANTVRALCVRNDSALAVAGTEDGQLWLVGLPDAKPLGHWRAHSDRVTTLDIDPSGEWLVSGSRDREVRLWRQTGERFEIYLILRHSRPIRHVAFGNDGNTLLVVPEGETAVRCWRLNELRKCFVDIGLDQ